MSDEKNPVVSMREVMIKIGLEAEMRGMRLTAKAPRCFAIIKNEYNIKVPRGPQGKRQAYEAFCAKIGREPKPADVPVVAP